MSIVHRVPQLRQGGVLNERIGTSLGLATFLLGLICWIAVLRLPLFFEALGQDEGLYLAVANTMLRGGRLYTDVWDNKPIGIFMVYAAIIKLFGISTFAINLASAIVVFVSSCLVCLIGREVVGAWRPGVIAAFILPAYMLGLGANGVANGANTELFMMVPQGLSVWLLVRHLNHSHTPGQHLRMALVFGLLQGLLFQMKFPAVFEAAALGSVFAIGVWRDCRRVAVVLAAVTVSVIGFFVCTAVVFLYFLRAGGLKDMIFSNFIASRLYVSSPFGIDDFPHAIVMTMRRTSYFFPLIVATMVFLIGYVRRGAAGLDRLPVALLCAWMAGALMSATSTGYFRYFYYITLAMPLVLLGSLALNWALVRRPGWGSHGMVLAVILLAAYPLGEHIRRTPYLLLSDDYRLVERLVPLARSIAPAGSLTFFADLNPVLYPLTDTVPATRYPQAIAHVFDEPALFGVNPTAELTRTFDRRPVLIAGSREQLGPTAKFESVIAPRLAAEYEEVSIEDLWLASKIVAYRLHGR
jgi:4-amino-4-deoxy-L-arabinose transferase-like glycosyltransferase